jgi:iron(III) transport system substrate-binding protein
MHYFFILIFCLLPMTVNALTVYSYRHYESDQRLFELFTEKTGIPVEIVKAKADTLLERLKAEGMDSNADVLITSDASRLAAADRADLLQPVESPLLREKVPAHLRDPDNKWFGFTQRARVLVYHPDRVRPSELSSYEALADPKWRGRLLVRSSSNVYNQSLMAAMIVANGSESALAWARGLVANMARPPQGSDRDQMRAVAKGLADVAIVNTYYLGLLQNSSLSADREVAEKLKIFFPNQSGRGTHINISGAAVTKACRHPEQALQLLEFLVSEQAQAIFPAATYEYSVLAGAPLSKLHAGWGPFKADQMPLSLLGDNNVAAVKLLNKAGWR